MRMCDDISLVFPFLDLTPLSYPAKVAVGVLITNTASAIPEASPLAALISGEAVDQDWRTFLPPYSGSLWQNYQQLKAVFGSIPSEHYLDEFDKLLTQASLAA